jgi:molybdopterin-containing oxidoreductase family iron-sulfur binding subunit
VNRGKSSVASTASILDLYDPDRLKNPVYKNPVRGRVDATWDDFSAWSTPHFAAYDARRGRGLAFVADHVSSPTRDAMKAAVLARWPEAVWCDWSPASRGGAAAEAAAAAFGAGARVHYRLAKAACVLSLDADFMDEGPEALIHARDFGATRVVLKKGDQMSRLYVAESRVTCTGSAADHRIALAPSRIAALAAQVAGEFGKKIGNAALAALAPEMVPADAFAHAEMIADDLIAHRGRAVVIVGDSMPASVHAVGHLINEALGALGTLVLVSDATGAAGTGRSVSFGDLTSAMASGAVSTLVCLEANPLYDAPACCDFAAAWEKVGTTITLSVGSSETAAASTWSLNGAHAFESWGDVEAWDGTVSIVQPMIAPLYEPAKSTIEFLGMLARMEGPAGLQDGYELVLRRMRSGTPAWNDAAEATLQKAVRRALHDGVLAGSARAMGRPALRTAAAAALAGGAAAFYAAAAPTAQSLEVTFHTGRVGDGRSANNAWLQELPEIGTMVVWDNPVLLSPQTARELGLLPPGVRAVDADMEEMYTRQQMPQGRLATFTVDGRSMEVAVWILPGMPDGVAAVKLGYGRTAAGRVGDAVGHNTYRVRTVDAAGARGATLAPTGRTQTIASTQNHWSMESRETLVRAIDFTWWDKHAAKVKEIPDKIYGTEISRLTIAEQLGELSHTPPNLSAYQNPQNMSRGDADAGAQVKRPALGGRLTPPDFSKGPQWGMAIDLNSCTGCGACTIACQSENNIPVVGKSEVAKGREMAWIRVDRYFSGDNLNDPDEILLQPVACVHCENAPCEVVCPVNATVHDNEGTNNMAYNRCIGTRYCANNCPYKVRRFNFFDYGVTKFNGGLDPGYVPDAARKAFDDGPGKDRTFNQNFIPPRLRAKLDEISKMQKNPDVTVRSRGVMEKCTYCIQRINAARAEVKVRDIWTQPDQVGPIPDGFFQTACQQACPTDSIVFGDILDPASRVSKIRESHRNYLLLGYLNTRPRTTYLMRVRNPNEPLLKAMNPAAYEARLAHDPIEHHKSGSDHGAGDHGGHSSEPAPGGHSDAGQAPAYIDTVKRSTDEGYAMSLRVIDLAGGTLA